MIKNEDLLKYAVERAQEHFQLQKDAYHAATRAFARNPLDAKNEAHLQTALTNYKAAFNRLGCARCDLAAAQNNEAK